MLAQRGTADLCYTEGTNRHDWAPVTATNWTEGIFTAQQRDQWIDYRGFRLPMLNCDINNIQTNRFNEYYKAAGSPGFTNDFLEFGRDTIPDANTSPTTNILELQSLLLDSLDGGFRTVTTFMPDEEVIIHTTFRFYMTAGEGIEEDEPIDEESDAESEEEEEASIDLEDASYDPFGVIIAPSIQDAEDSSSSSSSSSSESEESESPFDP
jgi:hypothetical protein